MVRIGLVSRAALLREGVRSLLLRNCEAELMFAEPSQADLVARMVALRPTSVIVDFSASAAAPLTAGLVASGINVVALVCEPLERTTNSAVSAGAIAVVPHDSLEEELLAAVRDATQGRRHLSPALLRPHEDGVPSFALLSKREREVFMLIAKGLNNRQIAELLFISHKTVETHRGNIYEKFGVHCIVDIVHAAYRDGILVAGGH
jgi:two-component system response regulator NreC